MGKGQRHRGDRTSSNFRPKRRNRICFRIPTRGEPFPFPIRGFRYADGSEENVVSDTSWRVSSTAVEGWISESKFSSGWANAKVYETPRVIGARVESPAGE